MASEEWDRGFLVLDGADVTVDRENHSEMYTAYVWAMVAICRQADGVDGGLVMELPDARNLESHYRSRNAVVSPEFQESLNQQEWRALIPFFQHGNIADASVLDDIKRELAGKTVDTVLRFAKAYPSLRFALVCTSDENGDGAASLVPASGASIREIIDSSLNGRNEKSQFIVERSRTEQLRVFSDRLPDIVGRYLEHIRWIGGK